MPKLSSGLPKEPDDNGLIDIARSLMRGKRLERVVVMAVVDCSRITTDQTNGAQDATIRILRMEQVHPDDKLEAERLVRRGLEYRKGDTVLPLDLERDLSAWFGKGDPEAEEEPDQTGVAVEDDPEGGGLFDLSGAVEVEPGEQAAAVDDELTTDATDLEPLAPAAVPSAHDVIWSAEVVLEAQEANAAVLVERMGVERDYALSLLLVLALAGVVTTGDPNLPAGVWNDIRTAEGLRYTVTQPPSQITPTRKALEAKTADPASAVYAHVSHTTSSDEEDD